MVAVTWRRTEDEYGYAEVRYTTLQRFAAEPIAAVALSALRAVTGATADFAAV